MTPKRTVQKNPDLKLKCDEFAIVCERLHPSSLVKQIEKRAAAKSCSSIRSPWVTRWPSRQLRQMHREANAPIIVETNPFDPGKIQDCGTRPARHRTCEEYLYTNAICYVPPSECTACTASESMILWRAAQVLWWKVGVCGGREKTTESLGTNGDGIHCLCLAADVRFRASIFCPCPLDGLFFNLFLERGASNLSRPPM